MKQQTIKEKKKQAREAYKEGHITKEDYKKALSILAEESSSDDSGASSDCNSCDNPSNNKKPSGEEELESIGSTKAGVIISVIMFASTIAFFTLPNESEAKTSKKESCICEEEKPEKKKSDFYVEGLSAKAQEDFNAYMAALKKQKEKEGDK